MNLVTLLQEQASLHPERPALVDSLNGQDRVVSFGALARRVSAGACALQSMGLQRGNVILVFQPVSIELYELILAAFHAGVRVMLADPSAGREFLSHCCRRLMPDAYFGSWKAQCLRLTVREMRRIRIPIVAGPWFPGARTWRTDTGDCPITVVPDDEPALITFTSGSTGIPKAAVRSHGFLLAQHRTLSRALVFEDGEVDLVTLPVFVLANLASGLTSVLAATDLARPGTPDATAIRHQCERHGATRCTASPAFFEGLLRSPDGIPPFRKIFTGGAPVFPDLLRRLSTGTSGNLIHSVYGSTEAEPISHFSADESEETAEITRHGGGLCSGAPVAEIQLRVIDDRWGAPLGPMYHDDLIRLTVPNGQAGEIVVTGEHVLNGYLDGVGDSETKIHVDDRVWHRTGDAGWIDENGRIWLLGRCSEKLPSFPAPEGLPANALIYPFAIECAMREIFPETRMAAIAWQGDRTLVVGRICDPIEATEIRTKTEELGIRKVIHIERIPLDRRHNAKIDYPALREILDSLNRNNHR
ncbi:MAG: AMP-binding protein [Verrucomicrobiota bacterium]